MSAHRFLKLLDIGRSSIRSAVNAGGLPLPIRLDLSRMIFDSVSEAYHGLRQIFTTGVSITTFRPIEPIESELLAEMYCCIATFHPALLIQWSCHCGTVSAWPIEPLPEY